MFFISRGEHGKGSLVMKFLAKSSLVTFLIAGSMFAASPALAWYETAFFDENGEYVGGELRCDNGVLLQSWGQQTSNFTNTYRGYQPYFC